MSDSSPVHLERAKNRSSVATSPVKFDQESALDGDARSFVVGVDSERVEGQLGRSIEMTILPNAFPFRRQPIPSLRTADAVAARRDWSGKGRRSALATAMALLLVCGMPIGQGGAVAAALLLQATPVALGTLIVNGDPITSLIPATPDASTIYAIGRQGLYRSDDGAETWQRAGAPPPPGRVVAAEDDPLLLLAGSRPACAQAAGPGTPLSRSADGGATWQEVPDVAGVTPLAIWGEPSLALGASCSGLRLSTDAGKTWRASPLTDLNYDISSFAVVSGTDPDRRTALVGATSEGGANRLWRLDVSDPAQPTAAAVLADLYGLEGLAGHDRVYLAGVANGVHVSTDEGNTWRQSRRGLEDVTVSVDPMTDVIPRAEQRRGITAVAIDPHQADHLFAGTGDGLFASFDVGDSWQRVSGVEGRIGEIVLVPERGRLLAQTDAGVVVAALAS